jgi:hypothetical protein
VPLTTASPGGDPRLPVDEPEDAEPDDQQGGIWICRCHCWAASEQRFLPIEERWRSCRDGGGFFGQKIREVGERVSLTTLAASRPSVCLLGPRLLEEQAAASAFAGYGQNLARLVLK